MDRGQQGGGVAVLVVPFTAQGHLNQLLHLSLLLSSHGLPVHYASTSTHIRQAKDRLEGWDSTSLQDIHFHDLPLPPFPNPPPNPNNSTKFPAHLQPLWDTTPHLRAPLASLLRSLSATSRRLILVYDALVSFAAQEAAALPNTEIYSFICVPASYVLPHFWPPQDRSAMPRSKSFESVLAATFDGCFTEDFFNFFLMTKRFREGVEEAGCLINTCRAVEGLFIDQLAQGLSSQHKKLFAIGPLNPIFLEGGRCPRHECLEWLDKQAASSVVYVSFGSTSTTSDEQITELAIGLERSGQRFIWVLRDADRGDMYDESGKSRERTLPVDYERKVEGVGMVVRGWAPQLEILAHPSTGGFMSHCGWNSCMESLSMGVPVMAWPMHSDQPRNAMLMTEYLKAGVMVRDWDRRDEIVLAKDIEESIKRVMVNDEGRETKRRARDLGDAVREAILEGGSSRAELKNFIAHITR